jgi:cell division protein FtsQ
MMTKDPTDTTESTSRPGDGEPQTTGSGARSAPGSAPSTVLVDPRMHHRRLEVQRDRSRRRLRRLRWVLGVALSLVALVALTFTPLLDVDRVEVDGAGETPESAIVESSRIDPGDPMVTLNLAAAEERIAELPWIADADVSRDWPGTVRIAVTERTPVAVAVLQQEGLVAVVDADGRVLTVTESPLQGLVRIVGLSVSVGEGEELPGEAADALRVAAAGAEHMPDLLESVTMDLVGVLHDDESGAGARVTFGSADEIDEKFVALSAIVSEVGLWCLEAVDVEVATAPSGQSC